MELVDCLSTSFRICKILLPSQIQHSLDDSLLIIGSMYGKLMMFKTPEFSSFYIQLSCNGFVKDLAQ